MTPQRFLRPGLCARPERSSDSVSEIRGVVEGRGLRVLDLFSGIGGFSLGLERTGGFKTVAFAEVNSNARTILARRWPDIPNLGDVRALPSATLPTADVVVGGDPCPIRSRARSNGASRHPDLSGYFLAVVGRCRPGWVVRENVPAPDDADFVAALAALGYRSVVLRIDAAPLTGQSRVRDFVVGCPVAAWRGLEEFAAQFANGRGPHAARLGTRPVAPALTCHRTRYDSRDCYVWEPEQGVFRILDRREREAFAGFPIGWTDGLSEQSSAERLGNAVVPAAAEVIGNAIIAACRASPVRMTPPHTPRPES